MFCEIARDLNPVVGEHSNGINWSQAFQKPLQRNRLPWNQGNKEIALPDLAGDLVHIELPRPIRNIPSHRCRNFLHAQLGKDQFVRPGTSSSVRRASAEKCPAG